MKTRTIGDTGRYILFTYLVFWCSIALVAAGVFASGQNPTVLNWGSVIPSWTPTIVLLIMFRKLFPGATMKDWLRKAFAPRIDVPLLIVVTVVLAAAILAASSVVALRSGQPVMSLLSLSFPAFAWAAFFTLIQGATGEEAGWRGYLQAVMEQKAGGVIQGSLLVGLVWSFWHTPLWFASLMLGWNLVIYIVTFIIGNLCLAVIIGVCYSRCRNLAVPMLIHFVSNLSVVPYTGDPIEGRCWLVLFYLLAAAGFSYWHWTSQTKTGHQPQARGA